VIASERYCVSCGAANPPGALICFACGASLKRTVPIALAAPYAASPLLLDRYRILAQVGRGGFSAVYRAQDTAAADRLVAIKAISLSGLTPLEMIEATEAFNREVQLLSGLRHPHLPRIYHNFADRECWYLVMDFIEGITLEKHLEAMGGGRLPVGEVLDVGLLLCALLEYLHSRQPPIIFRDLKPANVMLKPDGRITLVDFGIARHFKPGQPRDTMPFGSPGYAAPEQYGRAQTTTRTDLYSLGVILHQLLTGSDPSQTPFRFEPLQLGDQPALEGLETLIVQMLELEPASRPAAAAVVRSELLRVANSWSRQHVYGQRVQGVFPTLQPSPAWQAAPSAPWPPGNASYGAGGGGGGGGQVSGGQQFAPQIGMSSSSAQPPPRRRNVMAIASLTSALASIFIPLATCIVATIPYAGLNGDHLIYFSLAMLMQLPALLAIIFGHIGLQRAKTQPGMLASKESALTGMIIGYISGSLYLGFLCLLLAVLLL
jgi:serine/threonine protein kinase